MQRNAQVSHHSIVTSLGIPTSQGGIRTHSGSVRQCPSIHPSIKIVSFSGGSGAGKNFLANLLQQRYVDMNLIRSFTTRELREGQDHEYRHIDREEFMELIANGEFAWHTD